MKDDSSLHVLLRCAAGTSEKLRIPDGGDELFARAPAAASIDVSGSCASCSPPAASVQEFHSAPSEAPAQCPECSAHLRTSDDGQQQQQQRQEQTHKQEQRRQQQQQQYEGQALAAEVKRVVTSPASEGDILGGRWEVLRRLGSGAGGSVYLCMDMQTQDQLAIKLHTEEARFSYAPMARHQHDEILDHAAQQPSGLSKEWDAYQQISCIAGCASPLEAPASLDASTGGNSSASASTNVLSAATAAAEWRQACAAANSLGFPAAQECGKLMQGRTLWLYPGGRVVEPEGAFQSAFALGADSVVPANPSVPPPPSRGLVATAGKTSAGGAGSGSILVVAPAAPALAAAATPKQVHLHWLCSYLVLQYAAGADLKPGRGLSVLLQGDLPALAGAGINLLKALQHLHDRGMVHRDVKPENVLVSLACAEAGGTSRRFGRCQQGDGAAAVESSCSLLLADLGLASTYKAGLAGLREQEVPGHTFHGTPLYASVRALRFYPQAPRDDLEALGCALLQIQRGALPWRLRDTFARGPGGTWAGEQLRAWAAIKEAAIKEALKQRSAPEWWCEWMSYLANLPPHATPSYSLLHAILTTKLARVQPSLLQPPAPPPPQQQQQQQQQQGRQPLGQAQQRERRHDQPGAGNAAAPPFGTAQQAQAASGRKRQRGGRQWLCDGIGAPGGKRLMVEHQGGAGGVEE